MKEINKKERIEIYKLMIDYFVNNKDREYHGFCGVFHYVSGLSIYEITRHGVGKFLPELKKYRPSSHVIGFWFNSEDSEIRVKILADIIKRLK